MNNEKIEKVVELYKSSKIIQKHLRELEDIELKCRDLSQVQPKSDFANVSGHSIYVHWFAFDEVMKFVKAAYEAELNKVYCELEKL